jgi:hypothetical protein
MRIVKLFYIEMQRMHDIYGNTVLRASHAHIMSLKIGEIYSFKK